MRKTTLFQITKSILPLAFVLLGLTAAAAQSRAFNFQGRFTDASVPQPTNGTYEMQFALFEQAAGGSQIGAAVTQSAVAVVNGIFSVQLDFAAVNAFDGAPRYLEIRVRNPNTNSYVTLDPRQPLSSSPYAVRAISATSADGLSNLCVGCVDDAKIASVSGAKVTGQVASAATADTLSATLPVSKGGTGSATQNFVDLSTTQTIGGTKTFANAIAANGASSSGNVALNDNLLLLRGFGDAANSVRYDSSLGGLELRGTSGFRFSTGASFANERMRLTSGGDLGLGTPIPTERLDVRGNIKMGAAGDVFAAGGAENLRIFRGIVQISNGTATVFRGSGFTVARTGVGIITLTFPSADLMTVIPNVVDSRDYFANVTFEDNSSATIIVRNAAGTLVDPSYLTFIAIGPRP